MEINQMNAKTYQVTHGIIPLYFFKQYLSDKKKYNKLKGESDLEGLSATGEHYIYATNSKFIDIPTIKEALKDLDIPYEEFIDAYAKDLKSL